MSKRITKQISHELINFAKRVEVRAHFFDLNATSAFEFARQMSSRHLQKKNDKFECIMVKHPDPNFKAIMKAEFVDGSVMEIETGEYKASDLRGLFYEKAEEVEDVMASKKK